MEANLWQNVQNVEKKSRQKRLGRWLAGLTKLERGRNSQLAYASAAAKPSGRQSANRKSNLRKDQNNSFFFLTQPFSKISNSDRLLATDIILISVLSRSRLIQVRYSKGIFK